MIRLSLPFLAAIVALGACNPKGPPRGPEETCAASCAKTATACQEEECWRGCNLILDRLAEGEGDTVVACVASATAPAPASPCDDRTWARCAVRVGVHADGGPPAPPPPKDWDEDQE